MNKLLIPILVLLSLGGTMSAQTGKTSPPTKAKPEVSTASQAAFAEDKEKKDEFVERLFSEQSYLNAQIIDKCFTLKFSPTCWEKFTDPANTGNESGFGAVRYWVRYAAEYAKREKIGDLYALAVDDKKIEKENRPMIDEMIKELRSKFSMTIESSVACTGKAYEMMMRYPYEVLNRIGHDTPEWSPTSGEAHFTTVLSTTAKDMSVKISPDGKYFTVTGPAYVEAYDTQSKISKGMERANKNR